MMTEDRERKLMSLLDDDPSLILLLKNKYATNRMWEICIEKEPQLFRYKRNPSKELCILALQEDGNNLKYIVNNPEINLSAEMIWTAIKSYPPAIFYLPRALQTDALKECAFDRDPSLMNSFTRIRTAYLERRLQQQPSLIRYVQNASEDMWISAIEKDPNVCPYVKKFTPRIRQLIQEKYPTYAMLLPALKTPIPDEKGGSNSAITESETRSD